MINRTTCKYFLKNQCKFGANCFNSHDIIPQSPVPRFNTAFSVEEKRIPKAITPSLALTSSSSENLSDLYSFDVSSSSKPAFSLCKAFLYTTCTNQLCPFYHGYSEHLVNVSRIPCHETPIIALCSLGKFEFASCDKSTVKHWKVEDKIKCIYHHTFEKGDIKKMVSIGNSIVFTVHLDEYLSECTVIYLIVKGKLFQRTSKIAKVNDIVFHDTTIFCFGSTAIEAYRLSNEALVLIKSFDIINEIITVALMNNIFLCGHGNGQLTSLQYTPNSFFEQIATYQLHESRINQLIVKTVDTNSNYLISISEDKKIQVFNIEKGMTQIFMKMFNSQIESIFTSANYNGEEVFCLCFENGVVSVLNHNFDGVFEITSHDNKVLTVLNHFI